MLSKGRVMFGVISIGFCGIHSYFFDPFIADYLSSQFGLSSEMIGLAFSAYGLGYCVSGIIGGVMI